jgi:hypothetical protein
MSATHSLTTSDAGLECRPAGIPISLRPFFQEYVLEDLDPERSAFTVIERTLAWGDIPELSWLFVYYGPERLARPLPYPLDELFTRSRSGTVGRVGRVGGTGWITRHCL